MRNEPERTDCEAVAALRDAFIEGMSRTASTVHIVTSDGAAGRAGVTISAMAPLSADSSPAPSLVVCLHRASRACVAIRQNGCFCVNVLKEDQSFLSDVFAGRTDMPGGDRFSCAQWRSHITGSPVLAGALAAFDCTLAESRRIGTHYVLFGTVRGVFTAEAARPLVYANRRYGRVERLANTRFDAAA